jgi:hypothetical protein
MSMIMHDRLFTLPVAQLEQFTIFDDGDKVTLAADKIDVLVADLRKELHGDPDWFELRYM